ncbi:PIN domain-containing protein [Nitrosomonas sp.]|uniref:PIN domain-containing protein n=1 Tax=Nitrosomonas sp. TaxID=42353 RepID=UPI0025CE14D3|nr:PIN domain-containing protein [Nitrosomonas sp.]
MSIQLINQEDTRVRTNYILIDYENVQQLSVFSILEQENFKVIIFIGANQTKISTDIVIPLQRLGSNVSYIQIASSGPNALDFHIAYYIGQLSAAEPNAYFHIISKDTGFDPLISHLKTNKILAYRSHDISNIPVIKTANSRTLPEKLDMIITFLEKRGTSRPRTVKTLANTISSLFQNKLPKGEVVAILNTLSRQKLISITDTKVSYSLSR